MKRYALFFLSLLTLALPITASSQDIQKKSFVWQGQTRTYYLYTGQTMLEKPAPLIVLLHGSGRNGLSLVEKWRDLARQEGIIIVGPDAANPANWTAPIDGPEFLRNLVADIESKYSVNPSKVYLFGHSSGAFFALIMGLLNTQYYAAVAIHAGALPNGFPPLVDSAKRKIPIAFISGTNDRSVPITLVRASYDELRKRGFPVELKEIPNHDHWYYDLAPVINRSAWEFLSRQELGAGLR
jgi:poly(3-hydroxybutyrate) depolymerase